MEISLEHAEMHESAGMYGKRLSAADADIVSSFLTNFKALKGLPIVLYGVGLKTKVLLENLEGYKVVGLMDKASIGSMVYGKKVLAPDEVAGLSSHIVIVSNYASAELIYRRIEHLEESCGIVIYHLNGTRAKEMFGLRQSAGAEDPVKTLEDLKKEIEQHEVISFDVFDTLLTRRCLSPSDIFRIVERRIHESGIKIEYADRRIEADRIAHTKEGYTCDLISIYRVMTDELSFSVDDINDVIALELDTERSVAAARCSIVEALRYAKSLAKHVLLTSDTYFSKEFVETLLLDHGITDFDMLVVSSDLKKSKYAGDMWEHIAGLFRNKRILHVGDDEFTDGLQAERLGIRTFRIYSTRDLLDRSSLCDLPSLCSTVDDRLLLGTAISSLFNDPFVLSGSCSPLVNNFYLAGYVFFGPLVFNFLVWLIWLCAKTGAKRILFLSRDCYVLQRLFNKYTAAAQQSASMPISVYFYASRRALSVASITTGKDVADVFYLSPYVTRIRFAQFLHAAFGVCPADNDPNKDRFLYEVAPDTLCEHIQAIYADDIILNAAEERECYHRYWQGLDIGGDEVAVVVNFVGGGITQHYFEKIFSHEALVFAYFQTTVDYRDVPKRCEAHALYGMNLSPYTESSNRLIRHYLTAESVFSAPDEQFVRFSDSGDPVFENSDATRRFGGISQCHDGIDAFCKDMISSDPGVFGRSYSNEMVDAIFGSLFASDRCSLSAELKADMNIRDSMSPDSIVSTVNES